MKNFYFADNQGAAFLEFAHTPSGRAQLNEVHFENKINDTNANKSGRKIYNSQ